MPIGSVSNLAPTICHLTNAFSPILSRVKIADLGIGFGIYGAAVRQWMDSGVSKNGSWRSYLLGVEVFDAYRNPAWDLYDYVHVMPIEDWLRRSKTDRFHAILLNDVIEHMTKAGGQNVIEELKGRLEIGGKIIVTTPGVFFEQDAVYGNAFETHRSLWEAEDLKGLGFELMPNHSGGFFDGRTVDGFGNQMLSGVYTRPGRR